MRDQDMQWVPPPDWPRPPAGWSPPAGWTPDPAWGPPPTGWVWWQPVPTARRKDRPLLVAGAVLAVLFVLGTLVSANGGVGERGTAKSTSADAGVQDSEVAEPAAPPPSAAPVEPVEAEAPPDPQQAPPAAAVAPLLVMAAGGDGDSWRDTGGVEYRMGLINTPETDECGGAAATAYRKRALAGGFRAEVYASDRYGRNVAVVIAPNGVNLNVAMARDGIADDRYLDRYRHENPLLAAQLDEAFATAKADGVGIWSACRTGGAPQGLVAPPPAAEPAPPAAAGDCHPDYVTCIPIKGDGSGRGQANDLDCGDIDGSVRLRSVGVDPYRLDADGDGVGCDS